MWNLYFNVTNCKVMHIGRKNEEADYKMKVNEDEYRSTAKCNEEKDLGVIFGKSFSFDVHIQSCINQANKMIGILKRTLTFLDKDIFNYFYRALVRPHLEYGNEIRSPYLKRQSVTVERIQRRATRLISTFTDLIYTERLNELDLSPLKYRRFRGDFIQVYKIIN